jgi:inner membrane protein
MPTVITHAAVPLAMALGLGRGIVSGRLLAAGIAASILPDLDVLAFRFGIPYAADFGHRGFSHSIVFAALVGLVGAGLFRAFGARFLASFLFLFVATVSHGVLDAFTTGGLGVAFLWPWSAERFFAPLRVIQVSPFGIENFLSRKGVAVLQSELWHVWLPLMGMALAAAIGRRVLAQQVDGT